jgi:hypothetical protein
MSAETRIDWPTTTITRGLLADPLDPDYIVVRDDFVGGSRSAGLPTVGEIGWITLGIGGGLSAGDNIAGVTNHPGIFRIANDTASDNFGASCSLCYSASFGEIGRLQPLNALTGWRLRYVFRLNSSADVGVRIGLTLDGNTAEPADGIWLEYDTDESDTNFTAVCRASSTETKTSLAVAVNTTWNTIDIFSNTAGTISFSLNGGTAVNIATNVPSISMSPWFMVVNRTTSIKTLDMDYFGMLMIVSR